MRADLPKTDARGALRRSAAALVQTGRIPQYPLILFGRDHWEGLIKWVKKTLVPAKLISPGDMDLFIITDDPQEVVDIILDYERRVGPPDVMPKAFA